MLDGIDVHPFEAHCGGPGEMFAPAGKRPGKEGKEVIERHRMRSGSGWNGTPVLLRRRRAPGRVVTSAAANGRYKS